MLEEILGRPATVSMTVVQAREYSRRWLHPSLVRRLIRKLLASQYIYPIDENAINNYASRAVFSNQKAREVLCFKRAHSLVNVVATLKSRQSGLAAVEAEPIEASRT